jgi:hypothetical protein
MRAANLVTASVLMLLGGVAIFDSVRLGIGWGTDGPKSGFFPFWLGLLLMVSLGLIVLRGAFRASAKPFVSREQLRLVLKVLWPATGMVVLTQVIGLYVASALYLGFYMRWVGRHSWLAIIVLAISIPIATFFIFEKWFLVPMPKGPLEAWLGY